MLIFLILIGVAYEDWFINLKFELKKLPRSLSFFAFRVYNKLLDKWPLGEGIYCSSFKDFVSSSMKYSFIYLNFNPSFLLIKSVSVYRLEIVVLISAGSN